MNTNAIQSRLKQIFAVHSHEEICEFVEAKRLNNRRDYRIIAEYVSDFKKASPLANKMGNKLVDRILDAAPGRPALYDELVKKDFRH